jgi:two-component system CheB/CheR fusion protein
MPDNRNSSATAVREDTGENAFNGAAERRDPDKPTAVVGIGASAGGVSVLQQFFNDMPADSGLAFVVVMHLSPDFESQLARVIQHKTAMPVVQVNEPVEVRPNHVYVIPPSKQLAFSDGTLQVVDSQQAAGRRVTIDLFFRTLAHSYGQRAVCVVLSGTDQDGMIGLKHIRAQGGLTIAQDPTEAEYDSMPAHAIKTGMVDWVLPVAEIAPKLIEFVRNENRMQLPPEEPAAQTRDAKVADAPGGPTVSEETRREEDEYALADVMAYLHDETGHNFAHYKRATLLRRVARRMQVNTLATIPEYVEFLRATPREPGALLQDLLIGVTHFFRDPEAFVTLEENIPQLFAGKGTRDQLRVWVPGCATGEEAYSIAMLLCEHADRLKAPPSIQVFATDIDDQSIHDARHGTYSPTIEADVPIDRLRRFFVKEDHHYRVKKDLRDLVLFASHNLLSDAPFSRLDLVSCRNLLIYLNGHAQEQAFDVFHFALRAGGMLFIGGAESANSVQGLFSAVDAKHRLFVRRSIPRPLWKVPLLPPRLPAPRKFAGTSPVTLPVMARATVEEAGTDTRQSKVASQERRSVLFGELHLKLLEHYGAPSVLVNEAHNIVHLSERAGRYLTFMPGEPSTNLLHVIHPSLRVELRTALFRAAQTNEEVIVAAQEIQVEGTKEIVDLHVRPIHPADSAHGFFLVLFQTATAPLSEQGTVSQNLAINRELDNELQFLKEQLHATVEQYEASSEELKASNEELQAMNEEMRSAAEELETSQEELQSVNEELTTVNHELKEKVDELSQANSDLQNLMFATDVGTIFLDREMKIKRFTPRVQEVFNLLPTDLGRPISDITHKLSYEALIDDAEKVLRSLKTVESEVRVGEGNWFLARISPYRTADDHIAGVVATFIDITERKRSEMELREVSQEMEAQVLRFDTIMGAVPDFVYQFDLEGRFTYVNQSLLDLWGKTAEQALGRQFHELDYTPELAAKLQRQIQEVIETRHQLIDETPYTSALGSRNYEYLFFPLMTDDGSVTGVAGVTRDITERKESEQAVRESALRYQTLFELVPVAVYMTDADGVIQEFNQRAVEMWGRTPSAKGEKFCGSFRMYYPDGMVMPHDQCPMARVLRGEELEPSELEITVERKDGAKLNVAVAPRTIKDNEGNILGAINCVHDITHRKRAEEALRKSEERFRLLVEGARDYAMFLLDPESTITFWSTGAERVFGWSQDEAIGQTGAMIFTPEDRKNGKVEEEINTALNDGRALDRRFHLRKDGSRFWADGILTRLDDENGKLRGFAKVARDATDQRRAEDEVAHARDELEQRVVERTRELLAMNNELERTMAQRQQLERELLEISEREKRRIGEDLHDMVCQELTATALFLKSSAKKLGPNNAAAAKTLEESAETVNRNVVLARKLAGGLQAIELTASGLKNALRDLAASACDNSGIKCHVKITRGVDVPDDAVALHLYRIAQEAVTNAVKHSGAKNVLVTLDRNETHTCVSVQDDGKGFVPRKRGKGLGLHMMRYRANALGGELKIERRKSGGMDVTCVIPSKR